MNRDSLARTLLAAVLTIALAAAPIASASAQTSTVTFSANADTAAQEAQAVALANLTMSTPPAQALMAELALAAGVGLTEMGALMTLLGINIITTGVVFGPAVPLSGTTFIGGLAVTTVGTAMMASGIFTLVAVLPAVNKPIPQAVALADALGASPDGPNTGIAQPSSVPTVTSGVTMDITLSISQSAGAGIGVSDAAACCTDGTAPDGPSTGQGY